MVSLFRQGTSFRRVVNWHAFIEFLHLPSIIKHAFVVLTFRVQYSRNCFTLSFQGLVGLDIRGVGPLIFCGLFGCAEISAKRFNLARVVLPANMNWLINLAKLMKPETAGKI